MQAATRTATPPTALVVGAGVIGLACALQLQRRGYHVAIADPDREGRAPSWGNAGHLAAEQVEPLASPAMLRSAWKRWYVFGGPLAIRRPLRLAPWLHQYLRACTPARYRHGHAALRAVLAEALPAWHRLAASLERPGLVREHGHLVLWESAASAAAGRARWQAADLGSARLEPLAAADRAALERSGLHVDGLRFAGTGQIADLPTLAAALQARFQAQGGERLYGGIEALTVHSSRAAARLDDGSRRQPDLLLLSAGVRSRQLLAPLGIAAPLVAERGYHLQWAQHDWPSVLPPTVFEDRSLIATRFDSGLRIAGFVEYAPLDAPADAGKWARLEHHVRALGLPVRDEPARWMGARPTLPDYLPAIGRSAAAANLLYAFGHQHLGLTLAAITGELIGALAAGETPAVPLQPFDLGRFIR